MKKWMVASTVMLLAGFGATSVQAVPDQGGSCDTNGAAAVKALSTTPSRYTTYDLVGSGGEFAPTPLVGDPEVTDHNLFRMLSYTFYLPVAQGTHTVEVKWAGCCPTKPQGNEVEIGGANLLIYYR